MPDLPLEVPERTELSDEYYAAVGRALAFAIQLESNIRALAAHQVILASAKKPASKLKGPVSGHDDFEDHIVQIAQKIWRTPLQKNVKKVAQPFGLLWLQEGSEQEESFKAIMREAVDARNTLAHEHTVGAEHELVSEAGRAARLADLREIVRKLAKANLLAGLMMHGLNDDPLPCKAYIDRYVDKIVSWACAVEQ